MAHHPGPYDVRLFVPTAMSLPLSTYDVLLCARCHGCGRAMEATVLGHCSRCWQLFVSEGRGFYPPELRVWWATRELSIARTALRDFRGLDSFFLYVPPPHSHPPPP